MHDSFAEAGMQTLKDEFLGVYGTLRRRSLFLRGPEVSAKLRFFCCGQIRGKLFCQGSYPAAVSGPRIIPVEVFLFLDPPVWDDLDRDEGCDSPHQPSSFFFLPQI